MRNEQLIPLGMREGLMETKKLVAAIWNSQGELVVIFLGNQGVGKSTTLAILNDSKVGGIATDEQIITYPELPYRQPKKAEYFGGLVNSLYAGEYPSEIQRKLLLSTMGGTGEELRSRFPDDPRLLFVGLQCDIPTWGGNLFRRELDYLIEDDGWDGINLLRQRAAKYTRSLLHDPTYQLNLSDNSAIDFLIDISRQHRINPDEAKELLMTTPI